MVPFTPRVPPQRKAHRLFPPPPQTPLIRLTDLCMLLAFCEARRISNELDSMARRVKSSTSALAAGPTSLWRGELSTILEPQPAGPWGLGTRGSTPFASSTLVAGCRVAVPFQAISSSHSSVHMGSVAMLLCPPLSGLKERLLTPPEAKKAQGVASRILI